MPKISDDKLKEYFSSAGGFNPIYTDTVKLYNDLKVHAEGIFPGELIARRRPSETDEILAYREKTYEPITKLPLSKAINCYSKIRRSPDWMISFPGGVPARIPDEETLENYCTYNLPGFVSITNWTFDILLPQNLIDANALIAVIPLENIDPNQPVFSKPVPILFNSDQVMFYSETEKYCVLRSRIRNNYLDATNAYQQGERYYYIDEVEIIIYEQGKEGYVPIFNQLNTIGKFPVFKVRSESYKQFDNVSINRSRLHAMVPFLNKAAAGDSDLEGSKIQHLYPLFWYFQNKDCKSCKGAGERPSDDGPVNCTSCGGSGKIKFSPYAHIQVDPAEMGKQSNPIPPAGYVTRDTAILELQEKIVEKNNYKALAAINMQFLDQSPLSISGDAKQVDREELNNTVYNTAEDLVATIDKVLYFINEWRFIYIIKEENKRKEMLPNIPVPQNFDLLPSDYLMEELAKAKTNKANPFLLASLEQEIAVKKFYNNPELSETINLYFALDPLPGISVDEKMSLVSNDAITKEDFVISSYMAQFIRRALISDKDFASKPYDDQMEVLKGYAEEKIKITDAAGQMIDKQKEQVLLEMKGQNRLPAPAAE